MSGEWVSPIRAKNLIWLAVLAGLVATAATFGTPHLRVRYVWNGDERQPFYYSCRYWGLQSFDLMPLNGYCPVILMAGGRR